MSTNINKASKTYALVEFINGGKKECAVVPLIWLIEDLKICYWPKTKTEQAFEKLVLDHVPYDSTWYKCKTHRILKTSEDYDAIVKYMEIILEHGSTEDDGMGISDVSLKKKLLQHCDDGEDSTTSQSSDSEVHAKTAEKRRQKPKNIKGMSEGSDSSHVLIVPKKKQKQERFDEEKTKNANARVQSRKNDGVGISDVSPNKELLQKCDDGEDSDPSQSSDSEVHGKTAKNHQKKHKNTKNMSEDSDSSHLLAVSKNKQKQERFDREKTKNANARVQSRKLLKTFYASRNETGNPISSSVSVGENDSTKILSKQQFQQYVIQRFEEVKALMEQNNASFVRLLNSLQTYMNPTSKPDGLPDLPLTTEDEFRKLELMLSEKVPDNPDGREAPALAYTYLKGRLSTIGGADQRSCVMNILKFVMTNQLAMSYNWKGQHNKKSFEGTKLREVILRKRPRFNSVEKNHRIQL
ncbi:uncharacterized protein [Temnothorax nylanderi]|uniref:uncharacterized protein n=1 Tax=Temnothorax nylanderi TaxID=102681 RepID=UPI003A8596F3